MQWNCEVGFSNSASMDSQLIVTTETEMCHNVLAGNVHIWHFLSWDADVRSAQTADTGTQHCHTWIVTELMACSACGPTSLALIAHDTPANVMVRKGLWAHIIHIQPIAPLTHMHKHRVYTHGYRCLGLFCRGQYITSCVPISLFHTTSCVSLSRRVKIKTSSFTSIHAKLIQLCIIMLSIISAPVLSDLLRLRTAERWAACQKLTEQREKPE